MEPSTHNNTHQEQHSGGVSDGVQHTATPSETNTFTPEGVKQQSSNPGGANVLLRLSDTQKKIGLIGAAVLVVILAWTLLSGSTQNDPLTGTGPDGAVAAVNGVVITQQNFDTQIRQLRANAETQGFDTEDPEVKTQMANQAITFLINAELIAQAATESGVQVTEEEISVQRATIAEQLGGEEVLVSRMQELNISDEQLSADITRQLLIANYIDGESEGTDLAITEADVAKEYTELIQDVDPENIPAYTAVSQAIRSQLTQTKQAEFLGEVVDGLRSDATIEIWLN